MPYTTDMTWAQWSTLATTLTNSIDSNLQQGYDWWKKFYAMTYGLTDQQILALPVFASTGRTQADLDAMRACFNAMKTMYDVFNGNAAASQYNYSGYFLPFEG